MKISKGEGPAHLNLVNLVNLLTSAHGARQWHREERQWGEQFGERFWWNLFLKYE